MGKSVETKEEQIQYIKNRVKLLQNVVSTLDESAESSDLQNILEMLNKLGIKVSRFAKDWEGK
ncbi:prefoldin subunit 5 [Pullulanibacillus pueri]|uniref:Uncharacterized protein n=1 Tax=Pullulanibacillus pueri TaxID=1437324 RepID=A0A8J2ZU55_9BACL|nr:SE1561 family protein [Pullulanibacillus pueri]MBM7680719.1 prefoldin subunit 5 [Pullulanibacillus pueri]GGH78072.1 hypothetical protein GCM10007096_10910 [Pullulanibacillus pueri]